MRKNITWKSIILSLHYRSFSRGVRRRQQQNNDETGQIYAAISLR